MLSDEVKQAPYYGELQDGKQVRMRSVQLGDAGSEAGKSKKQLMSLVPNIHRQARPRRA